MKPERLKILKPFIINLLRRGTFLWKPRGDKLKEARVARGLYKCEQCNNTFSSKEIKLDHIEPVVDVKLGFQTFDIYIDRMFCEKDGFQALCNSCHDGKTQVEKELRKTYKRVKKALTKNKRK